MTPAIPTVVASMVFLPGALSLLGALPFLSAGKYSGQDELPAGR